MLGTRNPVVLVRGSEDWKRWKSRSVDEYEKRLRSFGWWDWSPDRCMKFVSCIRKWNHVFSINFFDYRATLKEIGKTKLREINRWDIFWEHVVFPTDDDDWFHPNIADIVVPVFEPSVDVVLWNCWMFDPVHPPYFHKMSRHEVVGSNGFAIAGKFGKSCGIAHNLLWQNIGRGKVEYLDRDLSVWVRHPASFMQLSNNDLPNHFSRNVKIPKELRWATDKIEHVQKTTADLVECRFL